MLTRLPVDMDIIPLGIEPLITENCKYSMLNVLYNKKFLIKFFDILFPNSFYLRQKIFEILILDVRATTVISAFSQKISQRK